MEPENIDFYDRLIREFSIKYPEAWAVTYQADVRTRREHIKHMKYELTQRADRFEKNGWDPEFKREKPWDSVFFHLTSNTTESAW